MTEGVDAVFKAVGELLNCGADGCLSTPRGERNGRRLCRRHLEMYDHGVYGEPCERCGSREWVLTPDANSVAWCAHCELLTYDESKFEYSW